jgi:hypothetical protein
MSASAKIKAAIDKAGGKRDIEASRAAAHKVGKANDLSPHTVRSILSRYLHGSGTGKKAAKKAPARVARKAEKRPVRVAKKARPVRVAKKAVAEAA